VTLRAAWLALLAVPVVAGRNEFDLTYFDVEGATSRELNDEIKAKAPIGDNGLRSDGYTRWNIDWTFQLDSDGSGCTASHVDVNLAIHMILPRWNPPHSAAPALVARWNSYVAALRIHEEGHRSRAAAAAADVRRALESEDRARDCATLEKRLNAKAAAQLDELRKRQAAYDLETESGRKQGVRRP
jgi:predicted secreted Zn-dependent protease